MSWRGAQHEAPAQPAATHPANGDQEDSGVHRVCTSRGEDGECDAEADADSDGVITASTMQPADACRTLTSYFEEAADEVGLEDDTHASWHPLIGDVVGDVFVDVACARDIFRSLSTDARGGAMGLEGAAAERRSRALEKQVSVGDTCALLGMQAEAAADLEFEYSYQCNLDLLDGHLVVADGSGKELEMTLEMVKVSPAWGGSRKAEEALLFADADPSHRPPVTCGMMLDAWTSFFTPCNGLTALRHIIYVLMKDPRVEVRQACPTAFVVSCILVRNAKSLCFDVRVYRYRRGDQGITRITENDVDDVDDAADAEKLPRIVEFHRLRGDAFEFAGFVEEIMADMDAGFISAPFASDALSDVTASKRLPRVRAFGTGSPSSHTPAVDVQLTPTTLDSLCQMAASEYLDVKREGFDLLVCTLVNVREDSVRKHNAQVVLQDWARFVELVRDGLHSSDWEVNRCAATLLASLTSSPLCQESLKQSCVDLVERVIELLERTDTQEARRQAANALANMATMSAPREFSRRCAAQVVAIAAKHRDPQTQRALAGALLSFHQKAF